MYKKTIRLLGDYNAMKAHIQKLKRDIENIDYIGVSASSTEDTVSKTNKFYSAVENEVVDREKFVENTTKEIKRLELEVKNIDEAYKILSDKEKKVIKLKYFETNNNEWFKIAWKVGYSEQHCRRIRNHAVKKMEKVIFGK
ncbi:DUF722 domain-containing protein [Garciella nitratireducens]|nr:DUF722 domain-containing protein [Garciella nitratireducens]